MSLVWLLNTKIIVDDNSEMVCATAIVAHKSSFIIQIDINDINYQCIVQGRSV